jgi:DNA-binding transcriptional regulator YdaS (Cro superfamily)
MTQINRGIAQAIQELGSAAKLAEALNVKTAAVYMMANGKMQVPAERAVQIEALTGVPCEAMRPDVDWSVLRSKALPKGAASRSKKQSVKAVTG